MRATQLNSKPSTFDQCHTDTDTGVYTAFCSFLRLLTVPPVLSCSGRLSALLAPHIAAGRVTPPTQPGSASRASGGGASSGSQPGSPVKGAPRLQPSSPAKGRSSAARGRDDELPAGAVTRKVIETSSNPYEWFGKQVCIFVSIARVRRRRKPGS